MQRLLLVCAIWAVAIWGGSTVKAEDENAARRELTPTGALRVGIVFAPSGSPFFVVKDPATGEPRGVTVELGAGLARKLGVAPQYVLFPNSGELTEATSAGAVDVAFMPVDAERRTKVAFGPAYYLLESTYMVAPSSDIRTLADMDRPTVRVVGIANTTTIRSSARTLKTTTPIAARSVDEAMGMIRSGEADAVALSRDSLGPLAKTLPGARVLDGAFQQTTISVAVPQGRPAALAYVGAFLEEAKRDGTVRRALDTAGFQNEVVAPAGR
jgi:polar amino acid transport system substrate-binding protein